MKMVRMLLSCGLLTTLLHAQSWQIGPFTRPLNAPVITPNPSAVFADPISGKTVHWEALHTFNPAAAIAPDGSIAVLYRAEDDSGDTAIGAHTSRLGLAFGSDGLHFIPRPSPVLSMDNDAQRPNEYPGGTEDPRLIVTRDGLYVVTYTQWARDRQRYSIGVATSRDLIHWTKYGPAFDEGNPYYHLLLYKSGSILTELRHGRLVAAKLHGRYWMYWGEIKVGLATSSDLIHWSPVLDAATGLPRVLLAARGGRLDSGLPETGPPAVLTRRGIVLLYNGKNADPTQPNALTPDPKLSAGAYSVGEALFSAADPSQLLARTDEPVFKPERPYERTGQYAAGTTFAEGLVAFRRRWFLYYGTADSYVGVATAPMR